MRRHRIFIAITIMAVGVLFAEAGLWAANSRPSEVININSEQPSSSSSAVPTVTIQVGNAILHVPNAYIDGSDGFQGKFGYVKIRALLPCLAPENSENTDEFHRNILGRVLVARLSSWDIHELTGEGLLNARIAANKSVKYLRPHPTSDDEDNIEIPGSDFLLYKDDFLGSDLYSLKKSNPLFLLDCGRYDNVPYPSCSSRSIINQELLLDYRYSRTFVDRSIEESLTIDRKIKDLFILFLSPNNKITMSTKKDCK